MNAPFMNGGVDQSLRLWQGCSVFY